MTTVEEMKIQIQQLIKQLEEAVPSDVFDRIKTWHNKAQIDYFGSYIYEYFAFINICKEVMFKGDNRDRNVIQHLKQDNNIKSLYIEMIRSNSNLSNSWNNIIKELKSEPFHGDLGWWNNISLEINRDEHNISIINDLEDWGNMIEFLYQVRNNMFHGGKNPSVERDILFVENGYFTLRALVLCLMSINKI